MVKTSVFVGNENSNLCDFFNFGKENQLYRFILENSVKMSCSWPSTLLKSLKHEKSYILFDAKG